MEGEREKKMKGEAGEVKCRLPSFCLLLLFFILQVPLTLSFIAWFHHPDRLTDRLTHREMLYSQCPSVNEQRGSGPPPPHLPPPEALIPRRDLLNMPPLQRERGRCLTPAKWLTALLLEM